MKFEDRFDKYLDPSFFQHRVGKLYILRHLVFADINELLPYVGFCARAVDFKDLTNGDFRCGLRIIKVIESFRGAVKSSLHLDYGLNQLRDTQERIQHMGSQNITFILGLILENMAYISGQVGFLILKL